MKNFYFLLLFLFTLTASAQTLDITISKNGSNQLVMTLNQDASFQFNQSLAVGSNSSPSLIIKNAFATNAGNILSSGPSGSGITYISNTTNTASANQMGAYGFNYGPYDQKDAVILFPEHTLAFQSGDIITIKAGTIISSNTYDGSNANNTIPTINSGPYTAFLVSGDFLSIAASQVNVLPIKLTSFTGHSANSSVVLNWETSSETNSKAFEIQHSVNKAGWQNIDFVNSKGTKDAISKYQYTHLNPNSGQNYYRLKSIDNDGKAEYSQAISVKTIAQINIIVTPNPSSNTIKIEGVNQGFATIVDMQGKVIKTQELSESGIINVIDFNPGYYLIKILSNDKLYTKKFLKK